MSLSPPGQTQLTILQMRKLGLTALLPLTPYPFHIRHCTMHHHDIFQVMPSASPEAVSISVLSLQATQRVNHTAGFDTRWPFVGPCAFRHCNRPHTLGTQQLKVTQQLLLVLSLDPDFRTPDCYCAHSHLHTGGTCFCRQENNAVHT